MSPPSPDAPSAVDQARIDGGGLVQVIVTGANPLTVRVFLNGQPVAEDDFASLSVDVEEQDDAEPIVRATLEHFVTTVTGEREQQRAELFPCTLDVVAMKRRIAISCATPGSLDDTWIRLGLSPEGEGREVHGARACRILISDGILDAKLTWDDGQTEDLLPQGT